MLLRRLAVAALLALLLPLAPRAASASVPAPDDMRRERITPWHHVFYHLNAYRGGPGDGWCNGTWDGDTGVCWGQGETTSLDSYPFAGPVRWNWFRTTTLCPHLSDRDRSVWTHELYLRADHTESGGGSYLCGWIDDSWSNFALTGGLIKSGRSHEYQVQPTSTDRHRRTQAGGPIGLHLSAARDGYVFRLHGYISY